MTLISRISSASAMPPNESTSPTPAPSMAWLSGALKEIKPLAGAASSSPTITSVFVWPLCLTRNWTPISTLSLAGVGTTSAVIWRVCQYRRSLLIVARAASSAARSRCAEISDTVLDQRHTSRCHQVGASWNRELEFWRCSSSLSRRNATLTEMSPSTKGRRVERRIWQGVMIMGRIGVSLRDGEEHLIMFLSEGFWREARQSLESLLSELDVRQAS